MGLWGSGRRPCCGRCGGARFPLKDTAQACSVAAPPAPPAPAAPCMALRLDFVTPGPWQLLTGHVLLFQDRSLRPEEIEGETRPLRAKGYSAIQEAEGRETGGKRGRDPLTSRDRARSGARVRGVHSRQLRLWLSTLTGPMSACGSRGSAAPSPTMSTFLPFPRAPRRLQRI